MFESQKGISLYVVTCHVSRGRLRAGEHIPQLGDEPLALVSRGEARAAAESGVAILEEAEQ